MFGGYPKICKLKPTRKHLIISFYCSFQSRISRFEFNVWDSEEFHSSVHRPLPTRLTKHLHIPSERTHRVRSQLECASHIVQQKDSGTRKCIHTIQKFNIYMYRFGRRCIPYRECRGVREGTVLMICNLFFPSSALQSLMLARNGKTDSLDLFSRPKLGLF